MIKQLIMTGFLATGLFACTPNQTVSQEPILKPEQVWEIKAIPVDGQAERFLVTTGKKPSQDQNGALSYENTSEFQAVGNIKVLFTRITYYKNSNDEESMLAYFYGWIVGRGFEERYCRSQIARFQKNLTFFEGSYATNGISYDAYRKRNDTSKIGKCTITLQK